MGHIPGIKDGKIMYRNFYYSTLLFFIFFASCRSINLDKYYFLRIHDKHKTAPLQQIKQPSITIWIHGTRAFFSKYFFQKFFYRMLGLHPASSYDSCYHLHSIARVLSTQAPDMFSFDNFYFFGWSGKLSFKARTRAARELYQGIKNLAQEFEAQHQQKPYIRIITHSHGGNVALNMAKIKDVDNSICIDELILLACPVQEQTINCAHDDLFESIYSLYSLTDSIQVLDPQGFHYWCKKHKMLKPATFFSGRCFPDHCTKVHQAAIKLNGSNPMHIDFLLHKFLKYLPEMLCTIKSWDELYNDEKPKILSIKTK